MKFICYLQIANATTFLNQRCDVPSNLSFGDFYGGWEDHLKALICHELAHVVERTACVEPTSQTCIQSEYNVRIQPGKKRMHHNLLWRSIYRDLKLIDDFEKFGDVLYVETSNGLDIFYRGVK